MAASSDIEMVYVVEGDRAPRSRMVAGEALARDIIKTVARELEREELEVMYLEDQAGEVGEAVAMEAVLGGDFLVIHIATKHLVKVEVSYNGRAAHRDFGPNATIRRVLAWAISPEGLGLHGELADFQLKFNGEILPLELHVGQLAYGRETVRLALVFKVKPQG